MTPFRWKNCYADVNAWRHGLTIQSFLGEVVSPAVQELESRIFALGKGDVATDAFALSDMQLVLSERKLAFALAIQSIWERQLRSYLRECAEELQPGSGVVAKIDKAKWKELCDTFRDLRGIALEQFPSFLELDVLHLLGNASRHGDGKSAETLAERCPEFWPDDAASHVGSGTPLPVALLDVPSARLQAFGSAISCFWSDAEYIYNESIEKKHPTLEARLARERLERTWIPVSN